MDMNKMTGTIIGSAIDVSEYLWAVSQVSLVEECIVFVVHLNTNRSLCNLCGPLCFLGGSLCQLGKDRVSQRGTEEAQSTTELKFNR